MIETQPTGPDRTTTLAKVLVVDDDEAIAAAVCELLREEGYEARLVTDSRKAIETFTAVQPDLVILDVLMPSVDGISLCLQLRRESDVPVLFLSAKRDAPDRVVGLRIGADDYVGKPFDNDELLARVGALLRRGHAPLGDGRSQLRFGRFVVDLASVQAIAGERHIALTPTEFKLLRTLAGEPGRVFTRDDLLTTVWGYEPGSDTRLVDVHVGRLRKKLLDAGVAEVAIETSRGFGYRLGQTATA
ncbi:MAG: response regulator transcription factor [Chloroflexota bacterium]|nr:response regulator transcription factor [Chloroflexota bacterium]MDE3192280.1 response regulator transcription factor [Chloroflexota bacterium]